MVLINDKKFSCGTCIKGHRSSNCTHTDRPLFEIKKKGRPVTQCEHCRKLRQTKQLHIKCECGSKDKDNSGASSSGEGSALVVVNVTRKGVPGDIATFPRGLKDVHDMAAAADALSGLSGGSNAPQHSQIKNLLNPCQCRTGGGKCICCKPIAVEAWKPETPIEEPPMNGGLSIATNSVTSISGSRTPAEQFRTRNSSTDNLSEMFWQKATTGPSGPLSAPPVRSSNHYHPAHTSPHVHKTRLFSPYDTFANAGGSNTQARRTSDLSRGSSFNKSDAQRAQKAPSSNGAITPPISLPPLNPAFLAGADTEAVLPSISFPTESSIHLSGCTCGDDCSCPGCATHMNVDSEGGGEGGGCGSHTVGNEDVTMGDAPNCPSSCTSCFDCRSSAYLPSGLGTVEELIEAAAAAIPAPAYSTWRALDQQLAPNFIDPHNLHVLPPSAVHDEKAAEAMGFVRLKPLQCCNGRCQCESGKCSCSADCCGCCLRCECSTEETEDTRVTSRRDLPEPILLDDAAASYPTQAQGSCCGSSAAASAPIAIAPDPSPPLIPVAQPTPPLPVTPTAIEPTLPLITPPGVDHSAPEARTPSISRSSSIGAATKATRLARAPSMTSKSGSILAKALLLPHQPRPILPRPPSAKDGDILSKTISTSHGRIHHLVIPHTAGAAPREISSRTSSSHSQRAPSGGPPKAQSDIGHDPTGHDKQQVSEWPSHPGPIIATSDYGFTATQSVKEEPDEVVPTSAATEPLSSGLDDMLHGYIGADMGADGQPNYFDAFGLPEAVPDFDDFDNLAFDGAYLGAEMPDLTPNEIEAWLQQVLTQQDPAPDAHAMPNGTQ